MKTTLNPSKRVPLTTALAALLAAAALPAVALAQASPGASPSEPGSASPSAPPSTMQPGATPSPSIERAPMIDRAPGARESAAPRETGEGANALIGLPVVTTDGQKIGDVTKVATDPSGKVREIELKVGGFLGMGGKSVMVPGEKVNASGKKQVVLLMTSEQAKQLIQ